MLLWRHLDLLSGAGPLAGGRQGRAVDVSATGRKLRGVLAGKESIPYAPQLGSQGLVWALVNTKQELTYKSVTRSSFLPGLPCAGL